MIVVSLDTNVSNKAAPSPPSFKIEQVIVDVAPSIVETVASATPALPSPPQSVAGGGQHCDYFAGIAPGCGDNHAAPAPPSPALSAIADTTAVLRGGIGEALGNGHFAGAVELLVKVDDAGVVLEVRDLRSELGADALARIGAMLIGRKLFETGAAPGATEWRHWTTGRA